MKRASLWRMAMWCLWTCVTPAAFGQARGLAVLGAAGKRLALVVGNDNYRSLPHLKNAVRDAEAMRTALVATGFQATLLTDASREGLDEGVDRFIGQIQPGDVALFFYSGHAVQIGGENYLSPVDLQAVNEVQARDRSLRAGEVVEEMESRGADLQIVILDACRNNPFGKGRSIGGGGLAAMTAGRGTVLAYATAPGTTADDNSTGQNGLYTTYLLKAMGAPGLTLEGVLKQASADVQSVSGGRQVPWMASSMRGEFYFHGGPARAGAAAAAVSLDPAAEIWTLIKDSRDPADFESFARAFPSSELARGAEIRAAQLRRLTASAAPDGGAPATIPSAGATQVNPKDGLLYVWIPPGTFTMGCSPGDDQCAGDDKPPHRVTLTKGFWMGQTEVTQESYETVTGQNPSELKGRKLPVGNVSWNEAHAFCSAVGKRLPTEAEWEYAARAGDTSGGYSTMKTMAWYEETSDKTPHEVGQKQANRFGLYDMLGNVWEYVADWFGAYSAEAVTDPHGPSEGESRVMRGGAWYNTTGFVYLSSRDSVAPNDRGRGFGLRCVGDH